MTKTMKRTMLASLVAATLLTAGVAFNAQTVDASSECLLTMHAGASVRIDDETGTGIRFTADIPAEYVKTVVDGETTTYEVDYSKGITEMGMIVVPSYVLADLEEGENVFTYLETEWNAPKNEVSSALTKAYKDENADTYYVAGAIVELQDVNIDREYQAIPYTYDGTNYAFGTASEERTIHYVFNQALEKETDATKRAKLLNKVVEMQEKLDFGDIRISNFDGYNLSKFAINGDAEWNIVSAGVGSNTGAVEDGALAKYALPWQATTKEDAQDFTVTYENGETLTFPAQVWMKEISDVADLREFTTANIKSGHPYNGKYIGGYFGVTADIDCDASESFNGDNFRTSANDGAFTFDGNNHTITNYNGNLTREAGGTFKDITFLNAKTRECRGIFALQLLRNVKVENVSMTVTTMWNKFGDGALCANAQAAVYLDNVNIVIKNNQNVNNSNYTAGHRQGVLVGRVSTDLNATFVLNDCTFVSDSVPVAGQAESLPLLGIFPSDGYVQPDDVTAGAQVYVGAISGTYKYYRLADIDQAEEDLLDEAKSTKSFRDFVEKNNLTNGWGPLNVS